MRFTDLFRLSLSALWQQKLRGFLTTLGVVFGAFVLVFSLSLGQGVQSTIDSESQRNVLLRKIDVRPIWQIAKEDVPEEEIPVKGEMSEERRQRIREALIQQKYASSPKRPTLALTQDVLDQLRKLEHVQSVVPAIRQSGWAILGKQAQVVSTTSADPDKAFNRKRIIAGDYFRSTDEQGVVLSEFLCYLLGVIDEADVGKLIGQKIRLEFRNEPPSSGLHFYFTKSNGLAPTRQEALILEKMQQQLPASLDKFNLTDEDKTALRRVLQGSPPQPAAVHQEDLTILGIVRMPAKGEQDLPWDWMYRDADVLLPPQTAAEVFFRQKVLASQGVDGAAVFVDREENVRGVLERITAMKLQAYAPLEYIERERFIYLLIFTTMACIAAVALLVAALGIANTMLMSVLERTREIGIFKAVGAGDATVQMVFLIEGAFIGLIGGGGGLLLGWLGSYPADAWVRSMVSRDLKIELKESIFMFPWWLSVSVIAFTVVVTTLAAVLPARRAARINPVTALRNE